MWSFPGGPEWFGLVWFGVAFTERGWQCYPHISCVLHAKDGIRGDSVNCDFSNEMIEKSPTIKNEEA